MNQGGVIRIGMSNTPVIISNSGAATMHNTPRPYSLCNSVAPCLRGEIDSHAPPGGKTPPLQIFFANSCCFAASR